MEVTFKLRPEPEETAVQSCRNVFQAEGHMASPFTLLQVVYRLPFLARIGGGSLSLLG